MIDTFTDPDTAAKALANVQARYPDQRFTIRREPRANNTRHVFHVDIDDPSPLNRGRIQFWPGSLIPA